MLKYHSYKCNKIKIIKVLFLIFNSLFISSCSTTFEKFEVRYSDDLSGTVRGIFRTSSKKEAVDIKEAARACDVKVKKAHNSDSYVLDYKFNTYSQLQRSVDCSRFTNMMLTFDPLIKSNKVVIKEITFPLSYSPEFGAGMLMGSNYEGASIPKIVSISVPGKIINASIDFSNGSKNIFSISEYEIKGDTVYFTTLLGDDTKREKLRRLHEMWSTDRKTREECDSKKTTNMRYWCEIMSASIIYSDRQCSGTSDSEAENRECKIRVMKPYNSVTFSVTIRKTIVDKILNY